jgi:hypothetical protein
VRPTFPGVGWDGDRVHIASDGGSRADQGGGITRSYSTAVKTAISLPEDTFRRAERAARRMGMSRSEFFARAAERWLADLEDDATTEAIDRAIAGVADETAFTDAAAAALASAHDQA